MDGRMQRETWLSAHGRYKRLYKGNAVHITDNMTFTCVVMGLMKCMRLWWGMDDSIEKEPVSFETGSSGRGTRTRTQNISFTLHPILIQ